MVTQFFGQEEIQSLVKTGNTTLQLPAGSQFRVGGRGAILKSALNLDVSVNGFGGLDVGAIASLTLYYVHAVISGSNVGLVASLSKTLPTGFLTSKLVGAFYSNEANQIGALIIDNKTDREIPFTPVFDQLTASNIEVRLHRDGRFLHLFGGWNWATGGGGTFQWYLPIISGVQLLADFPTQIVAQVPVGRLVRYDNVVNNDFSLFSDDTILDRLRMGRTQDASFAPQIARLGTEITNGTNVKLFAVKVPIVGWEDKIL